VERKIKKTVI